MCNSSKSSSCMNKKNTNVNTIDISYIDYSGFKVIIDNYKTQQ